jgi:hypothetical protein
MNRTTAILATCLAGALLGADAHADYQTYRFSGHISEVVSNDPAAHDLSSEFAVGDPFSGTLIIQTAAPDSSASSNVGRFDDAIARWTLTTTDYDFTPVSSDSVLDYSNDNSNGPFFGDHVRFSADMSGPEVDGAIPLGMSAQLSDSTSSAFLTDADTKTLIPLPGLDQFDVKYMSTTFGAPIPGSPGVYQAVGYVRFELETLAPAIDCPGDLDADFDTDVFDFAIFAGGFGCISPPSDLVTVEFFGYVTGLDNTGGVDVGSEFGFYEPIAGTFTYDASVADALADTAGFGAFPDSAVAATITIGDYTVQWTPGPSEMVTRNDATIGSLFADYFVLNPLPVTGDPVDGVPPFAALVSTHDADATMFLIDADADALTPTPDLTLIDGGEVQLFYSDPPLSGSVSGKITYVRIVPPDDCPGDLDGDGDNDVFDFATFAAGFGCKH